MKSNFRSSITIPEKSWVRFRDVFNDYVEKMAEASSSGGNDSKPGPTGVSSGDTASGVGSGGGGGGGGTSK